MTTSPTGNKTIFTAFTTMLDELGISATGDTLQVMQKERELMTALEQVRDFPLDWLPQIKAYALEQPDGRKAVKDPHKLIAEMKRLLAQGITVKKEDLDPDDFIDMYERQKWARVSGVKREDLPEPFWPGYDRLKERYG